MSGSENLQARLKDALHNYIRLDLRLSHILLGFAILVGAIINLCFARGWTFWPVVLAFGILTYMNEAVSRNGQGIPPVQVYAFFAGGVLVWFLLVLILAAVNPIILILGLGAILYRVAEAFLRQRQRERLIESRKTKGVCLHCGEVYDPNAVFCDSCGEEPNPDEAILKRTAQICRTPQDIQRARAILTRSAATRSSMSSKEQALLSRHRSGKMTHQSPLPKAAKLGPGSSYKRRG